MGSGRRQGSWRAQSSPRDEHRSNSLRVHLHNIKGAEKILENGSRETGQKPRQNLEQDQKNQWFLDAKHWGEMWSRWGPHPEGAHQQGKEMLPMSG